MPLTRNQYPRTARPIASRTADQLAALNRVLLAFADTLDDREVAAELRRIVAGRTGGEQ